MKIKILLILFLFFNLTFPQDSMVLTDSLNKTDSGAGISIEISAEPANTPVRSEKPESDHVDKTSEKDESIEISIEIPANDSPQTVSSDSAQVETVYVTEEGDTLNELPPIEKMPEVIKFVNAEYPPAALKKGLEGTVLMEIIVTDIGIVDSIRILKSLDSVLGLNSAMDPAAIKAIKQFKFSPAIAGGKAIPVAIQYEYHFSIEEQIKKIEEYVNFKGRLIEKGTRAPVKEGLIVIQFLDSLADTTLIIPFSRYLKKIGSFKGQYYEEGQILTRSDSMGRFQFKSIPAGSIKVTYPITGYRSTYSTEIIETGKQINVVYRLLRESYDEYEVLVIGKADKKEVAKKTIQLKEIRRLPGFGGDAVKVVQALPGVARPFFISGEIIVRGNGFQDNRYYVDGIDVPKIFHFGALRSVYNSNLISSVSLYPGGYSARYGGG